MMHLWMVWRYLHDGRKYFGLHFVLSVLGVAIGVASLVVAMAVVSGYESTLRQTVINMQGHLMLARRGGVGEESAEVAEKIRSQLPNMEAMSPFVVVEGLIIHNKKLSGVVLEGVDPESVGFVQRLDQVVSEGQFLIEPSNDMPRALIGKGIAKKFNIQVGEEFRLVVPVSRQKTREGFRPKAQKFLVTGIIDMGRTDYDERYIVTDTTSAQKFGELNGRISGWRIRLNDYRDADAASRKLEDELGLGYWARAWSDTNKNLFEAVKYERVVIFIIVMIMLVAAAFGVASSLFLNVVRQYSQIAILKAIGVRQSFIRLLFTTQGLVIGVLGSVLGVGLGVVLCRLFIWAERRLGLFPGEVYKLDFVELELRPLDLTLIVFSAILICYLATLAPAKKGASLQPVEGLRYE